MVETESVRIAEESKEPSEARKAAPAGRILPYTAVFIASTCIMTAELLASRLIARYLGQSLYTWTSCIGVFLGGIALGNYIGGRLADHPQPRRTLSILFLLCALATLLTPLLNHVMASIPWMWERAWATRIFLHVTITFIFPAVLLGGISPVAARMAVGTAPGEHVGRTLGTLYALGALGSIVGTYLTGFWLIAHFGTVPTLACVAAVLMLLALCVMPRSRSALVGLLLAGTIALGTASRTNIEPLRSLQFVQPPNENVLFERESQYSLVKVEVIDKGKNQLGMHLDRLLHSQMIKDNPLKILYEYMQVYVGLTDHLFEESKPVTALVLGGGGYVFPWYLELTRPGSRIDVVEIDPEVTEAAHVGFGLPRDTSIKTYNEDARQYMERLARETDAPTYDLIFSDVVSDYGVPFHLTTVEFAELARRLLKDNGAWAFNLIDSGTTADLITSTLKTCREVFPHVRVVICAGKLEQRATFVLVCSQKPIDYDAVLARVRQHQPFGGRFLGGDDEQKLIAHASPILLRDDFAPVEQMVARMLTVDPELQIDEFNEAATRAALAGHLESALGLFERGGRVGSPPPVFHYNYALALREAKRPEEALEQFSAALKKDPSHVAARDSAAMTLAEMGDYRTAGAQWEILTRLDPSYIPAWNNLANVLLILGRKDDARMCVETAERLDPNNFVTIFLGGNLAMEEKRYTDAVRTYTTALALAPERVDVLVSLADALLASGNPHDAEGRYRDALSLSPGNPRALAGMKIAVNNKRHSTDANRPGSNALAPH